MTGDLGALKLRAKESKKLVRENVEDAFDALVDLLEKFEEQKVHYIMGSIFVNERNV